MIAKWMLLLIGLLMLLPVLILTGCASRMQPSSASLTSQANLMQPCPPLEPLSDGRKKTVLRWIAKTSRQYLDCADGKAQLVEAIKAEKEKP